MRGYQATRRFAKRIESDDPRCIVTAINCVGVHDYSLDVKDTRTGYVFQCDDLEQWTALAAPGAERGTALRTHRMRNPETGGDHVY